MAKKPGRPKLPEDEKRTVLVPLRFRPDEAEAIAEAARLASMSTGAWCRHQVMLGLKRHRLED